jgi:hypothetical protein
MKRPAIWQTSRKKRGKNLEKTGRTAIFRRLKAKPPRGQSPGGGRAARRKNA